MIKLFVGTPGSGKSLHAAKIILSWLGRKNAALICNFPVNVNVVRKPKCKFFYKDNADLSVRWLVNYAKNNHKLGKEGQSLIIIDEAQIIFNSRSWARSDRKEWVSFFSQHRKYGFDIILITQNDRLLDRQIRVLIETSVMHRKVQNAGWLYWWLYVFTLGKPVFIAIESWYGGSGIRIGNTFFMYHKKLSKVYDSYMEFNDFGDDSDTNMMAFAGISPDGQIGAGGNPARGGPAPTAHSGEMGGVISPSFVVPASTVTVDAFSLFEQARSYNTSSSVPEEVIEEEVKEYGFV